MEFVFQTPGRIYFVMQFIRGGELFKHLSEVKRFTEFQVKFYAAQIAMALGHLHKNKIIYRDIKPENILLDETGYAYLTDFGMAKFLEDHQSANSFCGTPEYLAPEVIIGEGHNKSVDWWSLGILIYEMIVGIPPFYHLNQKVMYEYIRMRAVIFPEPKYKIMISDNAKDIIVKLLHKNQSSRFGSKNDSEEVLSHPFFKDIDLAKLFKKEIDSPYKPKVSESILDLSNFDPSFTRQLAANSQISEGKLKEILKHQDKFSDFE
jgi:serum/glucocorticoid-regulated kinase 2